MKGFRILPGLAALFLAAKAMAGGYQDLDALDARIASTVGDSGTPVPVDRRIRLGQCPQEPEISPPSGGALAVRCPTLGWKIRVAVSSAESSGSPAEILIRRGDLVELVVKGAGFSASAPGTALDEGAAGKTVRVKIPTSPMPFTSEMPSVSAPNVSMLPMSATRRPNRSPMMPPSVEPMIMPTKLIAATFAKAARGSDHSRIMEGMARPSSWLSTPSKMIVSAVRDTTSF